eukprot:COSAG04_NODE_1044_length_8579_cov_3.865802_3_plen_43_part_00
MLDAVPSEYSVSASVSSALEDSSPDADCSPGSRTRKGDARHE